LILKSDYEAITIRDICDEANIGRSTFYAHYTSKDDLKRRGLENLHKALADRQREALAHSCNAKSLELAFSLAMFEHARDHIDLNRALAGGRGSAVSLKAIRELLSGLVRSELTVSVRKKSEDAFPREFVVQYIVGAFMSVLTWWLDGGAKLPAHQIDVVFRRSVKCGIRPGES